MWLKLSTVNEDQLFSVSREEKIIEKGQKRKKPTQNTKTKTPKKLEKLHYWIVSCTEDTDFDEHYHSNL